MEEAGYGSAAAGVGRFGHAAPASDGGGVMKSDWGVEALLRACCPDTTPARSVLVLCHARPRSLPTTEKQPVEPPYLRKALRDAGATESTMPNIVNFAVVMRTKDSGSVALNDESILEFKAALATCAKERVSRPG